MLFIELENKMKKIYQIKNLIKTKNIIFYIFYKLTNNNIKKDYYLEVIDYKEKKEARKILKQINKKNYFEKKNKINESVVEDENVWFCWLQGLENAPIIVQECYKSIVNNFDKVIVIDKNNIGKYILLPEYIYDKWNNGIISNAHFSDLIRLELLNRYGGLWVDSTVYITNNSFYVEKCKNTNLFFLTNEYQNENDLSKISNWLLYSKTGNKTLNQLENILLEYWKLYNYPISYFIFHVAFSICLNLNDDFITAPNNMGLLLQRCIKDDQSFYIYSDVLKSSDYHKLNHRMNNESFIKFLHICEEKSNE